MAIKGDGIGQHQHHQDRDQPAEAGADREKQHPGADSGAKQAQGPGGVRFTPDERLVWLDAMLSVVLISCPHLCIELSVNKTGNLRYPGEIDIAPGNQADRFAVLDIAVEFAA